MIRIGARPDTDHSPGLTSSTATPRGTSRALHLRAQQISDADWVLAEQNIVHEGWQDRDSTEMARMIEEWAGCEIRSK